ncbi:hypothetical protein WKG93_06120 [Pantoea agglomerans]|uniref:hypothetical protein n=1 Tax=Enterobacter agglomerans TaxID=549 RepID=UPI0023B0E6A9|nr:hypothetical protein [Pantoea agglomerans]WEC71157.1 hypothetical protein LDO72_11970 [Pantoea agglomerans]
MSAELSNQNNIPLSRIDKLLDVLFSVSEISYVRIYLKRHDFETSVNAEKTKIKILDQFSGKTPRKVQCTYENLLKITKMMMLLGKHYCEFTKLNEIEFKFIDNKSSDIKIPETLFSKNFPFMVDKSLLKMSGMPVITAIEKKEKGVVFYFSMVRKKVIQVDVKKVDDGVLRHMAYDEEVKVQNIDTVYVPFGKNRAEFRISTEVPKKFIDDQITRLKDAFFTLLEVNGMKVSNTTSVNVNKAIEKMYNTPGYGRVVETSFLSLDNGIVMPRSCRKDVQVCLRDQEYHKAGAEKESVKCVGLSIRWERVIKVIELKIRSEIQLESLPNLEYDYSTRFVLENPAGMKQSLEWIDDIERAIIE